jgi:type IV pilus assembly protein PilC
MDLPSAIELAGDATRSARLASDGKALRDALAGGRALTTAQARLLPQSVPAAMQFASGHSDLATTLASLSEMYQRQADLRLNALPGILTPILVILLALIIGFIIAGLVAPLIEIIEALTH